jgi:N-acetylneuraminic acid mutarotase
MLIAIAIAAMVNLPPQAKASDDSGVWNSLSSMPTPRAGLGVVALNGRIYAIGGVNVNATLNTVEEYNPAKNAWQTRSPMPTPRSGFAIAVYQGKIYAFGGLVGDVYVGNNEVYDPVNDTWETKASMPTPRADISACVINDKIYVMAGQKYSNIAPYYAETDVNEVYNPLTDTWTTKTPTPQAVTGYASTVFNGTIYVLGGSTHLSNGTTRIINSTQLYNAENDTWSLGADLPVATSYAGAAATSGFLAPGQIILVGGYTNNYTGRTTQFIFQNGSWTTAPSMPTPRANLGIAMINDELYAIGGFGGINGTIFMNLNEKFRPTGYGTVAPKIQLLSPENQTYYDVTLNYTVNKATDWTGYSLDNQANVTVEGRVTLEGLSQGEHSIVLFANDSFGNMGRSNTAIFYIDRQGPEITILSPKNQSYDVTDLELAFVLDESTASLAYSLDGQDKVDIIGNVTLPALADGPHHVTVYAVDDVGNPSEKSVDFTIAHFPLVQIAAIIAISIIVLSSGYLLLKVRKQNITGNPPPKAQPSS